MADSMIERIARELCAQAGNPSAAGDAAPSMTVQTPEPHWQRFVPNARAILLAIREPNCAFWRAVTNQGDMAEHNARALWKHMIDAALAEDGR